MKNKKFPLICCIITALALSLAACGNENDVSNVSSADAPSEVSEHSNTIDVSADDFTDRDFDGGYNESTASKISFSTKKTDIIGSGAAVSGNIVTVSKAGTYILSGSCTDGRILIDADDTAKIQLVLNGLTLSSKDGPSLYIKSADKVFVTLANGTVNTLSDGESYTSESIDNADAVIFSKANLTLNGTGSLTVNGGYKHGIVSKDNLVITDGDINVTAVKTAICGKDCVKIGGGNITLSAGTDGIQSDNTENPEKGYVYITGGYISITSGNKGIKAVTLTKIADGEITIDKSCEGIENTKINIGGGKISIKAEDDGINAAGGNDSSALGGRPGMGGFSLSDADITISGGYIFVDADGDGIDSNGSLNVSGGTVLICGSADNGNGAFDYDGSAVISGGTVIALGSSGMAQNFNSAQNQGSMLVSFASQAAGTNIALCDEKGGVVLSLTATKAFNCALFTSPNVKVGSTYTVVAGADIDGADSNGFAETTAKTGGNVITTVNMTQSIVGSGGGPGGGGPGGGRPGGRW